MTLTVKFPPFPHLIHLLLVSPMLCSYLFSLVHEHKALLSHLLAALKSQTHFLS